MVRVDKLRNSSVSRLCRNMKVVVRENNEELKVVVLGVREFLRGVACVEICIILYRRCFD